MSTVQHNDGLLEYSVVYTNRALNHMSAQFQTVMKDLSSLLKSVYHADLVAIVPGGGTFAMESVVRQLAQGKHCLTLRNGFFNYRWSQIFAMGGIVAQETVLKAKAVSHEAQSAYAPADIDEVIETIKTQKPDIVFATHVETAAGILLADDYIQKISTAIHQHGGILVLDCIASGAVWVNMQEIGVDVLITAPQKGWTSTPCAGVVLFNNKVGQMIQDTNSDSFSLDLKKWWGIMQAYETGGHAYHCTMPTDSLAQFRDVLLEAKALGFEHLKQAQFELGDKIRALLTAEGYPSVAAEGYQAPGVVVVYTTNKELQTGQEFSQQGVQISAGVPLQCDEPSDFMSFRVGLFGLDKLCNIAQTVNLFAQALDNIKKSN